MKVLLIPFEKINKFNFQIFDWIDKVGTEEVEKEQSDFY